MVSCISARITKTRHPYTTDVNSNFYANYVRDLLNPFNNSAWIKLDKTNERVNRIILIIK